MGLPNPSRETKFSGANADREIFIFPVQLTTCRIGNLTRLIHALAIRVTIHIYTTTSFSTTDSSVIPGGITVHTGFQKPHWCTGRRLPVLCRCSTHSPVAILQLVSSAGPGVNL